MTNRASRRRYRKTSGRRVWVFSELNHDLRPDRLARIIAAAGLEQARLEAAARAEHKDDDAVAGPTDPTGGDDA